MNNVTSGLADVTSLLVLLAVVLNIKIIKQQNIWYKIFYIIVICCASVFIPIMMGYNLLFLMRGILSDLSITNMILAGILLIKNLFQLQFKIVDKIFTNLIVIIGSLLYLSTLGVLPFDIYDLGFAPNIYFLGIFFVVELILWTYNRLIAWVWLFAFVVYYFKLQNSINLFDYLIDPILWISAVILCIWRVTEWKRNTL